jgi:hypothetical protein
MSEQLMHAILALDSYNRGYNAGLEVRGLKLGDVKLVSSDPNQNISFFAQSYRNEITGEKLISYRGTDSPIPGGEGTGWEKFKTFFSPYQDGLNGFGIGRGSPFGAQATAAIEFYKSASEKTGEELGNQQNVTIVGQSLGGGLAGFVRAL